MDKVRVQDEDTLDSWNSGSVSNVSDLDILNATETDDLGRRILAHQREAQQAKKENRRPFFRAKPRPRTNDSVLTLGGIKATSTGAGASSTHQRTASEGSNRTDPPLNVPREWAKRARKRGEWRRNFETNGDQQIGVLRPVKVDEGSIFPHRTLYTGDANPILSSRGIMASVEDTPPSMQRKRQMSSPSSLHHMNTTLGPALESQEMEFNDASMLVSTPAGVSSHNRLIDKLTREDVEIETRDFKKSIRTRSTDRPGSAPSGDIHGLARRRSSRMSDKENESGDEKVADEQAISPRKGFHSRGDSIALLRKLARVSSLSPSPGKGKTELHFLQPKANTGGDASSRDHGPLGVKTTNRDFLSTTKVATARERLEQRRVRIQDEKAQKEEAIEMRLAAKQNDREHDTSKVTGGWVDTPEDPQDEATARAYPAPPAGKRDPRRVLSEPSHPKSALEAVVHDAKDNMDPQLGESTIASLEDIVNPNLDPTNSTGTQDLGGSIREEKVDNELLTQAEKDRRQEDLAIENLNKRLRSTRITIKDANRGLRRIENRIEAVESPQEPALKDTEEVTHEVVENDIYRWPRHLVPYAQPHNSRTICEHCGGSYTSVWSGLWTEFRELFWNYQGSNHDKFRLTWIGWSVVLWLLWLMLESNLAASDYNRYTINAFFPFVIPTILLRPFAPVLEPVGSALRYLIFGPKPVPRPLQVMPKPSESRSAMAEGIAETIAGDRAWLRTAAQATATATRRVMGSAAEALDQTGRIWDDEYL